MSSMFRVLGSVINYIWSHIARMSSEIDVGLQSKGVTGWLRWFFYGLTVFGGLFTFKIWASDLDFWGKIGATGSLASTLSLFPILYAVYEYVYGQTARERKRFERAQSRNSRNPGILIIDLKYETDVRKTVMDNRVGLGLSDIPEDMIVRYVWPEKRHINSDDVHELVGIMMEKYKELLASGADMIHLFYAGPVALAMHMGAIMHNKIMVKVYHFEKGKDEHGVSYKLWTVLNKPSAR